MRRRIIWLHTLLAAGSIGTYLWGMRAWHVLQHQDDPAFGVHNWRALMQSVAVLTATPSEPRVDRQTISFTQQRDEALRAAIAEAEAAHLAQLAERRRQWKAHFEQTASERSLLPPPPTSFWR